MLYNVIITVSVYFFMEFVAWFTHKYIMHGPLWNLHEDHHKGSHGFFEKNDYFFLIFAIPGLIFSLAGYFNGWDYKFYIGLGITLYGMTYFFIHDILIHQRFKLFRNTNNLYFLALRRAHKMHHKHLEKEDGECFGMLIVPLKYFKEARKFQKQKKVNG